MKAFAVIGACLLLAGCVEYQPSPVDWPAEEQSWLEEGTNVNLTVTDIQMRALAFSPELNVLRRAYVSSKDKAEASGYWDDPSLSLDVLRVLSEPKNPWTYGGSVSFTLPLTGIPALERRAAEVYSEADRWDAIAAEYEVVGEAGLLAHKALTLRNLISFLEQDRKGAAYREARQISERLVEAGEMSRIDLVQQAVAEKELEQTLFELREERLGVESKLRRMAGLPPTYAFSWPEDDALPEVTTNEVSLIDFIRAPKVRAALIRSEGKEIDLKKEIRKQYPELSLGPAYTREDGYDKVGFTLGLSLPLWNRNRMGIAEAKGARDESRLAAIIAWRDVVEEFAQAKQALALVGEWEVRSSRADAERLYEAGELAAGEFVACLQQDWTQCVNVMRRRLAALEAIYKINILVESLDEEGTAEEE